LVRRAGVLRHHYSVSARHGAEFFVAGMDPAVYDAPGAGGDCMGLRAELVLGVLDFFLMCWIMCI